MTLRKMLVQFSELVFFLLHRNVKSASPLLRSSPRSLLYELAPGQGGYLSHCACLFFSLALSTKPTPPPTGRVAAHGRDVHPLCCHARAAPLVRVAATLGHVHGVGFARQIKDPKFRRVRI